MPSLGVPELLLILVIVILLFGVGRIGKIAGELGAGIRNFREGLKGDEEKKEETKSESNPEPKPESKPESK
jgi:sec-independent protein translocase protein TatA